MEFNWQDIWIDNEAELCSFNSGCHCYDVVWGCSMSWKEESKVSFVCVEVANTLCMVGNVQNLEKMLKEFVDEFMYA